MIELQSKKNKLFEEHFSTSIKKVRRYQKYVCILYLTAKII